MLVVKRFKKYWSRDLSRGQLVAMVTAIFNHLSEFLNCFWICLDYSLGDIKNALQSSLVIHLVVDLELTHLKKACSMLVTKTLLTSLNVNKKTLERCQVTSFCCFMLLTLNKLTFLLLTLNMIFLAGKLHFIFFFIAYEIIFKPFFYIIYIPQGSMQLFNVVTQKCSKVILH